MLLRCKFQQCDTNYGAVLQEWTWMWCREGQGRKTGTVDVAPSEEEKRFVVGIDCSSSSAGVGAGVWLQE